MSQKKANANELPTNIDLEAKDFDAIRKMVRSAMLGRGVPIETVNSLLGAYRTMQPIFTAATRYYKDKTEANQAKASEATQKAHDYLMGTNMPDMPF